jgi:photosystem II stability/assembly factor-like uncharacterized protein
MRPLNPVFCAATIALLGCNGIGDGQLIASGPAAWETEAWVSTGGPAGGLGYDIRMRSDDPEVMFVTDNFTGVNKSTDGGQTWTPSNTGITDHSGLAFDAVPVFSLTIDPNDDERMWVGTSFNAGIYRSDDGGDSWTRMSNRDDQFDVVFRGFGVEPGNSDVVYAAGEVPSWVWNGEELPGAENLDCTMGVVYKSTDAGEHWNQVWYGGNLARYVLIDPRDTDRLYVSTGIFDRNAADSDEEALEPGGVGVLRSKDGGETWEVLAEDHGFDPLELWIGSLAMDPVDPDVLFAGSGNVPFGYQVGRPLGGVYRTTNGGDSWTQTLNAGGIGAVEICEGNPDVVYAASPEGVWRSEDNGVTWAEQSGSNWGPDGIVAGFPIDAQCDPRDDSRLFINNYGGGNFLTEDGGVTWEMASQGYSGALMADIAVVGIDAGSVVATARSGVFAYDGESWRGIGYDVARSLEGQGISVDPADEDHIFATLIDSSNEPLETFDGGATWGNVIMGVHHPEGSHAAEVVFSPDGVLFALDNSPGCWKGLAVYGCEHDNGGHLLVSWDEGETWEDAGIGADQPLSVAFSPSDPEVGYASFWAEDVYRSEDGGETWESMGDPGADWLTLAVDAEDPDRLLAGSGTGGMFISEDGGATWTESSAGLDPEASVIDLVVDPLRPGVAYAASPQTGVFHTADGGATWTAHNTGLTIRSTTALALSADGEVLYAAAEGAGVSQLGTPR